MHLNLFLSGCGHHQGAWRHPRADPGEAALVGHYINQARIAEQAAFDSVFVSDGLSVSPSLQYGMTRNFEPLTLLAAIAMATRWIGLIGTMSTSFSEPYNLARAFASLDHLSAGRAGWNIVTTAEARSADNFGTRLADHAGRYARAAEFVAVVKKLWASWGPNAVVADRHSGIYADPTKVVEVSHTGQFFAVHGPLNLERSPQGHPLLVQAGTSVIGQAFAARHAEVVFTVHQTLDGAAEFYRSIKSQAARFGRDPQAVKILPGLVPVLGDTEQSARRLAAELDDLVPLAKGMAMLRERTGLDLTGHPLDEPVPPLPPVDQFPGQQGRYRVIAEMVEHDRLTLRQLLARIATGRGHHTVIGTPEQVADRMQQWIEAQAADGFTIMPPLLPDTLAIFVDQVIPVLCRRGLFRHGYTSTTLRGHYGLTTPADC